MNLFELFVKIGVDDQASDKISGLSSKIGSGLAMAAKVGAAAVTAASAAVVALTKNSLEQYAEYEQLVGGVETLFKQSADTVMGYAENAYKTAGMSANEYMNTVTSFSASLLQSLGGDTEAATKYADMAITDMADNANKMGTSMESIQYAYQGFAKQNYTMLDNLKLGYGGTKEEMERLLEDAEKLSGIKYDISNLNDVYKAIHVIQSEIGITGTTAKEASTTIQGSVASMEAAWKNLLVGLADDTQDFDTLLSAFIDSVGTVGKNLIPRIKIVLQGIAKLVSELGPMLIAEIPGIVSDVLPELLNGALSIANAIIPLIPELVQSVISALLSQTDSIISAGFSLFVALIQALPDVISTICAAMPQIIDSILNALLENLPLIVQAGIDLLTALVEALPEIITAITAVMPDIILAIVDALMERLPLIIQTGVELLIALADGIIQSLPNLIAKAPEIISSLVTAIIEAAPKLTEASAEIIAELASGISNKFEDIKEKGREIVDKVKQGFDEKVEQAKQWGRDLIQNFISGVTQKWEALKSTVSSVAQSVKDFLGFSEPKKGPLSNFHTYAPDMMNLFIKGIKDNEKRLKDQIEKTFDFGERTITAGISYSRYSDVDDSFGKNYGVGRVSVVQNIYSEAKTAADLMQEAIYQQERAVLLGV